MAGYITPTAQNKHEQYLIRLGKRNQILKARNQNDGDQYNNLKNNFSIYVNGENKPEQKYKSSGCKSARSKKSPQKQTIFQNQEEYRSKTAPANDRRRFWGQGSVKIKTNKGEKIYISQKESEFNYSDDFEDDLNCTSSYSDSNINSSSATDDTFPFSKSGSSENQAIIFNEICHNTMEKVTLRNEDSCSPNDALNNVTSIRILLQTSWNLSNNLGLTEIQLYDVTGRKVTINSNLLKISGTKNILNDVSCLVNHRFKTTKEKNMVLFTKSSTATPVSIEFSVNVKFTALSKMLIWNYNKNLDELDYGVKYCEIFMNEKCVFKGDLDKGCGNQVFDYAHVINLAQYQNSNKNSLDKNTGQITSGLLKKSIGKPDNKMKFLNQDDNDIKPKNTEENLLLQSWNSLALFNHTQIGSILSASTIKSKRLPDNELGSNDKLTDAVKIPQLPSGKNIYIDILSTWGDMHYVGLNGIEFYSETGELIKVSKITANPKDINVLPGVKNDPRIIGNLIDGVNNTNDDLHMWLTPFTPNSSHLINIEFEKISKVAMARIWNYNKSRIHSCRGVRQVIIKLDNRTIFNGEIARASGLISQNLETFGDTILFTLDDNILENVSQNDELYNEEDDIE